MVAGARLLLQLGEGGEFGTMFIIVVSLKITP